MSYGTLKKPLHLGRKLLLLLVMRALLASQKGCSSIFWKYFLELIIIVITWQWKHGKTNQKWDFLSLSHCIISSTNSKILLCLLVKSFVKLFISLIFFC